MNNKKTTKRALLSSVMAIVLCLAMLIGTTFAWFTDSASTAVNKIQAGTLDIELQYQKADGTWEDAEGKALDFKKPSGHENESILWEPGCTYELPAIRILNKGNLALKYKLAITGIKGDAKLNEAIVWTNGATDELLSEYTGTMIPGENDNVTAPIVIKGHMKEEAGNEYRGLSIDGIGITVVATQYNYESDSIGPDYDKFADYPEVQPVTTADKLQEALASTDIDGKTIKLYDDIETEGLQLDGKNVAFDLNGKSLNTAKLEVNNSTVVFGDSSTNGEGKLETDDSYGVINAVNSNVTIVSGRFVSSYNKAGSSGYANVIQVRNSELTINGGYFENTDDVGSYNYLIKAPSYSNTERTTITINGGTFVSNRDYGYIVTGDSDANVDVVINGGEFKTTGRNSYLTNVKGSVVVNDCTFTATGNNTVFNIPNDSTVTVKGGTFSVNENSYTDPELAGLIFHRKTSGWTSVYGTLLVDPVNPVKVNQPTFPGFLAEGATQSAKDANGFYTISK